MLIEFEKGQKLSMCAEKHIFRVATTLIHPLLWQFLKIYEFIIVKISFNYQYPSSSRTKAWRSTCR